MSDSLAPVQVAHDPAQVGALLSRLDSIEGLLRDSLLDTEQTADLDQQYVVGGSVNGPSVISVQYPRTWRYVEITMGMATQAPISNDVDASAVGANALITSTLPAAPGLTTYLTGFEVTGAGATAASVVVVTVTGVLGGTKRYDVVVPAGATTSITPLIIEFTRPIPASAPNTAIIVTLPAFGAGNTNVALTAHGFQSQVLTTVNEVALFDGNLSLSDVSARHQHISGLLQQSNALAVISGSNTTFRAYLDQTGYFTLFFTGSFTGYINLRVRVLDKLQSRAERT